MATKAAILEALTAAEDTQRQLRKLSMEKPEAWKKEYSMVRQSYRRAMDQVAHLGDSIFQRETPEKFEQFKQLRQTLFSALDHHQSAWPVLFMDETKDQAYRNSVDSLEAKHQEFAKFIRANT